MLTLLTAIIYFFTLFLSSAIVHKLIGPLGNRNRNRNIDGLRGVLATLVVLFHFISTYRIENGMGWTPMPNIVLSNVGPIAVSLFFIISGYLFFDVIIKKEFDWCRFFISRLFRVYPLYILIILVVSVISYRFGGDSSYYGVLYWFVFLWAPIFGFNESYIVNSGVQWTLLYEMTFYAFLPLLWGMFNKKITFYAIVSVITCFILFHLNKIGVLNGKLYLLFLAGGLCNFTVNKININVNSPFYCLIGIASLLLGFCFTSPYTYPQFLMLMVSFFFIAKGVGVFKVLSNKYIVAMGEVSYSIYMIHGVVIFMVYRAGIINVAGMNIGLYLSMFVILMFIISVLSCITYKYIEKSSINFGFKIASYINNKGRDSLAS